MPRKESPGSHVKLRSSSFSNYALNLMGAVFSLFFLTFLARRLVVEDYANWVMIMRYLGYIVLPGIIYTYWLPRNISRGINDSKTGFVASIGMGVTFMPAYVLLMFLFATNFEQPLVPLLLSTFIVFFDFLGSSLTQIALGYKPQFIGYGTFSLKIVQALTGFLLVGSAALGLTGAVIAALMGRMATDAVLLVLNRRILNQSKFSMGTLKHWLKSSWLPIFATFASMIYTFDVLIVRGFYGNEVPIAYYGVALSLLSAVFFANVVNSSLYPKILAKKNLDDLNEAIWLTLLLSIPVATLMVIYAQPLIAIFGVQYVPAALPFQLFAIYSLCLIFSSLVNTAYTGLERIDESGLSSAKGLLKSALFRSSLVTFTINLVYIALLVAVSLFKLDVVNTTFLWAFLLLMSSAMQFIIFTALLKKDFSQTFPMRKFLVDLGIFLVPSIAAALPAMLLNVEISEGFYQMVLNLVPSVAISTAIYFAVLYAINRKFRNTAWEIIKKLLSVL